MYEGSELMVDVGVALAWVAISGLSLKWLSVFGGTSAARLAEPQADPGDEELMLEELYPLERFRAEGSRLSGGRRYATLSVLAVTQEAPAQATADVEVAGV
jgi:hypothetical protein